MSPEGAAYALKEYTKSLQSQADTAKAFFFGRVGEGMEGLLKLPEHVRKQIDQIIWEVAGEQALDPTDKESGQLIAACILQSMEERMGMGC